MHLIQKIYEVDSLCCPDCTEKMRVMSFIESGPVIQNILIYLDLWDTRNHDPPTQDAILIFTNWSTTFRNLKFYLMNIGNKTKRKNKHWKQCWIMSKICIFFDFSIILSFVKQE
jgi:hypothetical protein